jgi:hypothetical protein
MFIRVVFLSYTRVDNWNAHMWWRRADIQGGQQLRGHTYIHTYIHGDSTNKQLTQKVISFASQIHAKGLFLIPHAFAAHGAVAGVGYFGLKRTSCIFQVKHLHGTRRHELLCLFTHKVFLQTNVGLEPIRGRAHGRPLGMFLSNAFDAHHTQTDRLASSHLSDDDVIVYRSGRAVLELFGLLGTEWHPLELAGQYQRVFFPGASDIQLELDRVEFVHFICWWLWWWWWWL